MGVAVPEKAAFGVNAIRPFPFAVSWYEPCAEFSVTMPEAPVVQEPPTCTLVHILTVVGSSVTPGGVVSFVCTKSMFWLTFILPMVVSGFATEAFG